MQSVNPESQIHAQNDVQVELDYSVGGGAGMLDYARTRVDILVSLASQTSTTSNIVSYAMSFPRWRDLACCLRATVEDTNVIQDVS